MDSENKVRYIAILASEVHAIVNLTFYLCIEENTTLMYKVPCINFLMQFWSGIPMLL